MPRKLRNTHSLGRSGVPPIFLRTRRCLMTLSFRESLSFGMFFQMLHKLVLVVLRALGFSSGGFAWLVAEHLAGVPDTLLLVGVGGAHFPDQ